MFTVCRLQDINMNHRNEILNIIQQGFNREDDMLAGLDNPLVFYIIEDNEIVAVGFGDTSERDMIQPLKNKILYLHTISVRTDKRGKGLSTKLVKNIVRKYKREFAMYLHVRTTKSNPNKAALKSYEKCGFVILNSVFVDREDGPNNVMVLMSQIRSNIFNKKNTKKKKKTRIRNR